MTCFLLKKQLDRIRNGKIAAARKVFQPRMILKNLFLNGLYLRASSAVISSQVTHFSTISTMT